MAIDVVNNNHIHITLLNYTDLVVADCVFVFRDCFHDVRHVVVQLLYAPKARNPSRKYGEIFERRGESSYREQVPLGRRGRGRDVKLSESVCRNDKGSLH